jgi:hypothetical protein
MYQQYRGVSDSVQGFKAKTEEAEKFKTLLTDSK